MSFVQAHFQALKALPRYEAASLEPVPNGTHVVVIPGFQLPGGWNRETTTVYFVVPLGYPQARPDSFWTEPELRVAGGAMPQNATPGGNHQQGLPPGVLWFSWHPSGWNPNQDNLITYVKLIATRFQAQR